MRSVRATTRRAKARIVVVDDGSAPEHQTRLRRLEGVELVLGRRAAGLRRQRATAGCAGCAQDEDAVLLNSDMIAHHGWLERLQYGAYDDPRVGIAGPKLLYPDGTIQSAGTIRNPGAPEWFDHALPLQARATTRPPTCRSRTLGDDRRGALHQAPRARRGRAARRGLRDGVRGRRLLPARLGGRRARRLLPARRRSRTSSPRPAGWCRATASSSPSGASGGTWGAWLDDRPVRAPDGGLRIVYVSEDTGVGGGHRVVFQHLNGLAARGHDVELWTLDAPPDWFDLEVPVRTLRDLRRARRGARPRRGDQGRDVVEHRARRSGRPRSGAACPSTSCRTSRPRTTTIPTSTPRCWPATGRSSAT